MGPHLAVEQRRLALRLRARGWSLREIGPQVGCSHELVRIMARQAPRRPVRQDGWVPGPGRLTLADREEISIGVHADESFTAIAARLGRAVSTVSREVAVNGGRGSCRAWRAHQRAREQTRRPKPCKLAYQADFTIATGIPVYFCDPHSPWQRGSNENTNGLLRQYLPKGTDLSVHSGENLARIAASLSNRPRKTLGFMKPSEKLAELLAHTG
jgi:IS30 family transposase